MISIGVDVGGTNTDAVLLSGREVLAVCKTPTTPDITEGIESALADVVRQDVEAARQAVSVTVGTTHFVNAVVQRQGVNRVAALRICLPASASLPPFVDWPAALREVADGGVYLVAGGYEFDGRPLAPLDETAVRAAARAMRRDNVTSVAVSAVFSPLNDALEQRAAVLIHEEHPNARVTLSATIGRIGLLERENATLLNACLLDLADRTATAFDQARQASGLKAPLFITQNDGTIAPVATARRYPVFSFASGPTNSMRGAAFLSDIDDALVCDVGGTTTDVGYLHRGFPREANNVISIGEVRTAFRMPDVLSIALGGGTHVTLPESCEGSTEIGPLSVGHHLTSQARVFGGQTLTCTDVAVAAGRAQIGDGALLSNLPSGHVNAAMERIDSMIEDAVDRMKSDAGDVPLIAVGGGAILVPAQLPGISDIVRVPHYDVANAVGAAIAEVSGEIDRIYQDLTRDDALAQALAGAQENARAAGADPSSLRTVEVEDFPLAYMPGNTLRVRVRVVGPLNHR
jgi:N-methylhydantoinase A/oxoprolinase/acetone carboxylase beta subunit